VPHLIRVKPKPVFDGKPTISTSERQEISCDPLANDLSFSGRPISLADFSAEIDFNPNVADMALGISRCHFSIPSCNSKKGAPMREVCISGGPGMAQKART
jgi:hypothetical protein